MALPSITECKTYDNVLPGSARQGTTHGIWKCSLRLPPHIIEAEINGFAATKDNASDIVCREAMARLLARDPHDVVLRPKHWRVPVPELVDHIAALTGRGGNHQPLAVHHRPENENAGALGRGMEETIRDKCVADVIRECLLDGNGSFDPSKIPQRHWSQLNLLLDPGDLRVWIETHPDFAWAHQGKKGMMITWRENNGASAPSSASVSGTANPVQPSRQDVGAYAPGSASAREAWAAMREKKGGVEKVKSQQDVGTYAPGSASAREAWAAMWEKKGGVEKVKL